MAELYIDPKLSSFASDSVLGKVALITGASRGVGAQVAHYFALAGADLVINYRSKMGRAEEVAREASLSGRHALPFRADLTNGDDVQTMIKAVETEFDGLDYLVLNASGGLEKDKPEDYSMLLNCTAQLSILEGALPLLRPEGRVIFVTSHLAHFYGEKPVYPGYEPVAIGKNAGEKALLKRVPELSARFIKLIVVSGDMIDGSITPRLLNRQNRGIIDFRKGQAGRLPTVEEFAKAIVDAALDNALPTGQIVYVGAVE